MFVFCGRLGEGSSLFYMALISSSYLGDSVDDGSSVPSLNLSLANIRDMRLRKPLAIVLRRFFVSVFGTVFGLFALLTSSMAIFL